MRVRLCRVTILLLATAASPAAPPLEAYGRLPGVEHLALSPSGERVATIAVMGERRRLIVATTRGKLLQSVDAGNFKTRDVWWAGDDHVLAATSSTYKAPLQLVLGQAEMWNVFSLSVRTGHLIAVFDKNRTLSPAVFAAYGSAVVDGRSFGYFGGLTLTTTVAGEFILDTRSDFIVPDLYQVDLESGKAERIARGSPSHRGWVMGEGGRIVAHAEYIREASLWRLYAGEDRERLLLELPAAVEVPQLAGRGRTADTVLVYDPRSTGDAIVEVDIRSGARQDILPEAGDRRSFRSPDSGLLLGFDTDDADYPAVFLPELRARLKATARAFPRLRTCVTSFSRSFDRLVAFTDGGDDSGTWWLVDIPAGTADPIGYAYPKIRSKDVGATRMFHYTATDGLALDGVLTLPPGSKEQKLPVVMLPHGGPIGVSDSIGFDWWAQAYASAGYAVFQPNFRGSGGRDHRFREAGYGEWGGRMLTDIADGLAALAAAGIVDPRRACIVGGSYGGYAALAGVTVQHGLYRCAIAVAGVTDLSAFVGWKQRGLGSKSAGIRFLREAIGAEDESAMARISPGRQAARADAPVLLIHGIDDTVVPIAQSEAMADALGRAGKPHEFIRMKGEDHWLSRDETRTAMLEASVAFLRRHNPAD
ncbi:MAG: S9 family peptidase [Gammaproteobacteria bacterium]|nr:MAG: S9 family peptidase [Gammaproteobacteria bacterium]